MTKKNTSVIVGNIVNVIVGNKVYVIVGLDPTIIFL